MSAPSYEYFHLEDLLEAFPTEQYEWRDYFDRSDDYTVLNPDNWDFNDMFVVKFPAEERGIAVFAEGEWEADEPDGSPEFHMRKRLPDGDQA